MSSSRQPGPTQVPALVGVCPARTPGSLGRNDQSDPNVISLQGDTCGPTGINDYQPAQLSVSTPSFSVAPANLTVSKNPSDSPSLLTSSGSAPLIGVGAGAVARIPVPGTDLFIELKPRGWTPPAGSTSAIFIQDSEGKSHLRLDYGYNPKTDSVDYHWNQEGTFKEFGISNHTSAGSFGETLYTSAKYFKIGGRVLLVIGIALDTYSIVQAKKRWRQVLRVSAGWAGAQAGCEIGGEVGAGLGTPEAPGLGTIIGGFAGCLIGGTAGSLGASWAAGVAYDWVEETYFEPVPPLSGAPPMSIGQ